MFDERRLNTQFPLLTNRHNTQKVTKRNGSNYPLLCYNYYQLFSWIGRGIMRIQANISAINTNNRMRANQTELTKTLEKLSSGYSINRAADDAAGLTISEGMRAQIRGLNRAVLNAQDGLSLAQTTDSIVQETAKVLHRMRELTVQALNDTNTDSDRQIIQKEIDALRESIQSISKDSRYNDTLKAIEEHEATYGLLEGIRTFEGPISIIEGVNDELSIIASGQTTTVKIPAGIYDPAELLVEKLDDLFYEKNENIIISLSDERRLTVQVENSPDIAKIKGTASTLFFDYVIGNKPGMIIGTTDYSTGDGRLQIYAGQNDYLSFYVGPTTKVDITFPPGSYSREEIVERINQHLTGIDAEASLYGDKNISISSDVFAVTGLKGNMFKVDGYTSAFYDNIHYGSVQKRQPYALAANNLADGVTFTTANNFLTISGYTSNLTPKDVTIQFVEPGDSLPKTLNKDELVEYIQQKLDDEGLEVSVSLASNQLHLISNLYGNSYRVRLKNYSDEVKSQIIDEQLTRNASPVIEPGREIDGKFYGNYDHRQTMVFDTSNNTLAIKIGADVHSIDITPGTYDIADLVTYLNDEIEAAVPNSGVTFSSNTFNGMQSFYITSTKQLAQLQNSSANDLLFGGREIQNPTYTSGRDGNPTLPQEGTVGPPVFQKYPATVTGRVDLTNGIIIDDSNNELTFTVSGETHTLKIANKTYTNDELVLALNVELTGKKAKAELSGNYLRLVSEEEGSGVAFSNVEGLGMVNIRPQSLVLYEAEPRVETAKVLGVPNFANQKITVTSPNNDISFKFKDGVDEHQINLTIPDGEYTTSALVGLLNTALPSEVNATFVFNGNQFELHANEAGSKHQFSHLTGKLFEQLFQTIHYTVTPTHYSGYSSTNEAYAVGRADLPAEIEIFPTTNDMLTFDVTYQGGKYTIDVTIPPGTYSPAALTSAFNSSMQQQLENANLPKDLITAQIGAPAANQNVSNTNKFVLIQEAKNDGRNDSGQTIIDGIRGSAAYSIFYQADGIPKPSHLTGINDLSQGLSIIEGKNDTLLIDVNNTTFTLEFPAGDYAADELLDMINAELNAKNTGLIASYNDHFLRFSYKENGMVTIDGLSGNARDDLFFKTERREVENDVHLQIGANANQKLVMKQTALSDKLLRIHTISVETIERGNRALKKLDEALQLVTDKLGYVGAVQNRLEHVLGVNKNTVENLVAAESRIRDADMAKEMMKYTKQSILSQAMQTMLAQANQAPQAMLDLLK